MTTPSTPANGDSQPDRVDPTSDAPFDPYRFGLPERPVPPEYAPPGYVATSPPPSPYGAPQRPVPGPAHQSQPIYQASSYPYGPPSAPHGPYPQPRTGNGKAIAGLVLGILSIVLCFTSVLDAVLVILAVIFASLGLSEAKTGHTGGRGMAIAGLVCAAVGAVLAIVITVVLLRVVNECGGFDNNGLPGFNQCVQDHL